MAKGGFRGMPGGMNQAAMVRQAQKMQQDMMRMQEELETKTVEVKMKAGEGGRTFGSISSKEVAAACKEQHGIELDKKKLVMADAIKSFGVYEVGVKLHPKVTAKLKVHVSES